MILGMFLNKRIFAVSGSCLSGYYLRRKSFMGEWAKGHTKPSCILAAS